MTRRQPGPRVQDGAGRARGPSCVRGTGWIAGAPGVPKKSKFDDRRGRDQGATTGRAAAVAPGGRAPEPLCAGRCKEQQEPARCTARLQCHAGAVSAVDAVRGACACRPRLGGRRRAWRRSSGSGRREQRRDGEGGCRGLTEEGMRWPGGAAPTVAKTTVSGCMLLAVRGGQAGRRRPGVGAPTG